MDIKIDNIKDFLLILKKDGIQLNNLQWIEPFGISMLKSFISLNNTCKYELNDCDSSVESYINTILRTVNIKDTATYLFQEVKQDKNEEVAKHIVNKLLEKIPENSDKNDIKKYLNYMITEMLDNVVSHSNSTGFDCIVAQYYPKLKKIQISIVDTGIGFMNSLKKMHNPQSEQEAITKALKKEVTGSDPFDTYSNIQKHAGLGLYFLKRIISETKGNLVIVSNDTIYSNFSDKENIEIIESSEWKGSAIIFEFFIEKLDYEWEQIRKLIQNEVYPEDEEVEFLF